MEYSEIRFGTIEAYPFFMFRWGGGQKGLIFATGGATESGLLTMEDGTSPPLLIEYLSREEGKQINS